MWHCGNAHRLTCLVASLYGLLLLRSDDGIDLGALLQADLADFLRPLLRRQGGVRANSRDACVGGFRRRVALFDCRLGDARLLPAGYLLWMNCARGRNPGYPGRQLWQMRKRRLRPQFDGERYKEEYKVTASSGFRHHSHPGRKQPWTLERVADLNRARLSLGRALCPPRRQLLLVDGAKLASRLQEDLTVPGYDTWLDTTSVCRVAPAGRGRLKIISIGRMQSWRC